MIVTCVHIWVKPEHVEEFVAATIRNHEASIKEPGNLRFDLLRHAAEPTRFMLYEAYESEEAAKAHKQTAHYAAWRDTATDWMAKPREGVPYEVVRPLNPALW